MLRASGGTLQLRLLVIASLTASSLCSSQLRLATTPASASYFLSACDRSAEGVLKSQVASFLARGPTDLPIGSAPHSSHRTAHALLQSRKKASYLFFIHTLYFILQSPSRGFRGITSVCFARLATGLATVPAAFMRAEVQQITPYAASRCCIAERISCFASFRGAVIVQPAARECPPPPKLMAILLTSKVF